MRIEHSLDIDVPPETVWSITTDIERWPEWTPTVTSIRHVSGHPFGLGSVARIKQPMQAEAEWTVTAYEAGRRFSWESTRTGLLFVGTHEVHPSGAGTRSVLRMEASGWLAILMWPVLLVATRHAIARENQGLKERSEQVARAGAPGQG